MMLLTGTHSYWQDSVLAALRTDTLPNADMEWLLQGQATAQDYSSVYSRCGGFLQSLVQHSHKRSAAGLVQVEATGHLSDPEVLWVLRVYCHTGCFSLKPDLTLATVLALYAAAHAYMLDAWEPLCRTALLQALEVTSVLATVQAVLDHGLQGAPIYSHLQHYLAVHAHEVLRRTPTSTVQRLKPETVELLLHILHQDCANISEADLLEDLYTFCLRRGARSDVQGGRMLLLGQEAAMQSDAASSTQVPGAATSPVRKRCSSVASAPFLSCLRPQGLTAAALLEFDAAHPGILPPKKLVELLHASHTKQGLDARTFRNTAALRCNLSFPRTDGPASAVVTVQEQHLVQVFVAVLLQKHTAVELPALPAACGGILAVRLQVNTHVTAAVCINTNVRRAVGQPPLEGVVTVTLDLVNPKKDKAKRMLSIQLPAAGGQATVQNATTAAALKADGNHFEPCMYPYLSAEGAHNLVSITTSFDPSPATEEVDSATECTGGA